MKTPPTPPDLRDDFWRAFITLNKGRVTREINNISDHVRPFMLEKGWKYITLPGLQMPALLTPNNTIYTLTNFKMKDYVGWPVRYRWARLQTGETHGYYATGDLPFWDHDALQGLWQQSYMRHDTKLAHLPRITEEECKAFAERHPEAIKEANDRYLQWQQLTSRYCAHLLSYLGILQAQETILFTGTEATEALLELYPDKVLSATYNDGSYTVITKPLTVDLDRERDLTLDIGSYHIEVTPNSYVDGPLNINIWRQEGNIGSYISSYIRYAYEHEDDDYIEEDDRGALGDSICYGTAQDTVNRALRVGDAFTVLTATLDLLDQSNMDSDQPYTTWMQIARELHPEWNWCGNCLQLDSCDCPTCRISDRRISLSRYCSLCQTHEDYCDCVMCDVCGQQPSPALTRYTFTTENVMDSPQFRYTIGLCYKCVTNGTLNEFISLFHSLEALNHLPDKHYYDEGLQELLVAKKQYKDTETATTIEHNEDIPPDVLVTLQSMTQNGRHNTT